MTAPRSAARSPGGAWTRDRRAARRRLFGRSLLWGLAVGATTGGAVGALTGVLTGLDGWTGASWLRLAPLGALYGVVLGCIVAVIPSLLGAAVVTEAISARHPDPVSEDEVQGDLRLLFGAIIAVLEGVMLLAIFVSSRETSSMVAWLPFLAVINAAMVPMLLRSRRSLGHLWFEATR
jgi:hypothetical protein